MKNAVESWQSYTAGVLPFLQPAAIRGEGRGTRQTWLSLAVLFGLLLTGCGESRMEDHSAETSAEAADHERPPHKPQTFETLVTDLGQRLVDLTGPTSVAESPDQQQALRELRDLIQWIPELSAASELRKLDFDKAVACSQGLMTAVDGLKNGRFQDDRSWMESLRILQELVPASRDAG